VFGRHNECHHQQSTVLSIVIHVIHSTINQSNHPISLPVYLFYHRNAPSCKLKKQLKLAIASMIACHGTTMNPHKSNSIILFRIQTSGLWCMPLINSEWCQVANALCTNLRNTRCALNYVITHSLSCVIGSKAKQQPQPTIMFFPRDYAARECYFLDNPPSSSWTCAWPQSPSWIGVCPLPPSAGIEEMRSDHLEMC
jgi:hypothetical protein